MEWTTELTYQLETMEWTTYQNLSKKDPQYAHKHLQDHSKLSDTIIFHISL